MIVACVATSVMPVYGFILLPVMIRVGIGNPFVEGRLIPRDGRVLERARVSEVRCRPGLLANYAVETWAQSIVAFLHRVALTAVGAL